VVKARVGPVVAALDVGGDRRSGVVEGLKLRAPDATLLQITEPTRRSRPFVLVDDITCSIRALGVR